MHILTSQTCGTHKATIHSDKATGCRPLYRATCTEGDRGAARAVVRKHFGEAASATVAEAICPDHIKSLVGDYFSCPRRKQIFRIWTFNPRAK
jgi:hypothetical protein